MMDPAGSHSRLGLVTRGIIQEVIMSRPSVFSLLDRSSTSHNKSKIGSVGHANEQTYRWAGS